VQALDARDAVTGLRDAADLLAGVARLIGLDVRLIALRISSGRIVSSVIGFLSFGFGWLDVRAVCSCGRPRWAWVTSGMLPSMTSSPT
jgi:hypothetical protein